MNNPLSPIHKYNMGIVGNCSFLAYINTDSEIKWMCLPRFDSSFIFGSLLDQNKGGEFSVKPTSENYQSKQYYQDNTNILCTEFQSAEGKFRVVDFAPRFLQHDRYFRPLMLIRKIELLEGNPFIKVVCKPMGDYGNIQPEVVMASNHIKYLHIGSQVRLTTDIPLNYIENEKPFVLNENRYLVFTYGATLEGPIIETSEEFLRSTTRYWQNWIKSTSIPNLYQEQLIRSALILKLHQYEDTGGIIASGTTSLPEFDKSTRNWDYRYCWMRDTYYTLNAFNSVGQFQELEKYFHYIQNIIMNETHRIQPLYSVTGEKKIIEYELPLEGYLDNIPVRIGNEAYTHIQNDVYGQVLVSLLPLYTDKRLSTESLHKTITIVTWLLERIADTMDEPDAGLWEFRNKKQFHCYTYLFHWVGSKAAYKIADFLNNTVLKEKASALIKSSAEKIEACFSPKWNTYTQAIGVPYLDASCLQLITLNYIDPGSEKARQMVEIYEKELKTEQGLFFRYKHEDDFGQPKSTFLVCAFWYVEALACVGRTQDAVKTLESLIQYANHLGIFSEDVDPDGGQWGNFPQTYSHVGLINSVFRISRKMDLPLFF